MKDRTETRVASCFSLAKKKKKKNARSKKEARCIAKHLEAVVYVCFWKANGSIAIAEEWVSHGGGRGTLKYERVSGSRPRPVNSLNI